MTPGFFQEFPTAEDILYRPYGSGEMNMFNFAYNLLTLKFKKANQQLSNDILQRTLKYMNIGAGLVLIFLIFYNFKKYNTLIKWGQLKSAIKVELAVDNLPQYKTTHIYFILWDIKNNEG